MSMYYIEEQAKLFAEKAHKKQLYGKGPFLHVYHLQQVRNVIQEFEDLFNEYEFRCHVAPAAWLHDTIEDTDATFQDVFNEFGRNVARLVFAVSNELGENRREKAARTYPKIMAAGRSAIALKLADRIANVEHSLKYNHGMFEMYKKEYETFRAYLRLPGELKEMWARLDLVMSHDTEKKEEE